MKYTFIFTTFFLILSAHNTGNGKSFIETFKAITRLNSKTPMPGVEMVLENPFIHQLPTHLENLFAKMTNTLEQVHQTVENHKERDLKLREADSYISSRNLPKEPSNIFSQKPFPIWLSSEHFSDSCGESYFLAYGRISETNPNNIFSMVSGISAVALAKGILEEIAEAVPICPISAIHKGIKTAAFAVSIAQTILEQLPGPFINCAKNTIAAFSTNNQKLSVRNYVHLVERKKLLIESIVSRTSSTEVKNVPLAIRLPKSKGGLLEDVSEIISKYVTTIENRCFRNNNCYAYSSATKLFYLEKGKSSNINGYGSLQIVYNKLLDAVTSKARTL